MSGVEKMVGYLRAVDTGVFTTRGLLLMKAEAFEACARDSKARGDLELAEAEFEAARRARRAAEGFR